MPAVEAGVVDHAAVRGRAAQGQAGAGGAVLTGHEGGRLLDGVEDGGGGVLGELDAAARDDVGPQVGEDGGDGPVGEGEAQDVLGVGAELERGLGTAGPGDALGGGGEQPGVDEGRRQTRDGAGGDADDLHEPGAREAAGAEEGEDDLALGSREVGPRGGGVGHGAIMPRRGSDRAEVAKAFLSAQNIPRSTAPGRPTTSRKDARESP